MAILRCDDLEITFAFERIEYGELYYSLSFMAHGIPLINPQLFHDKYNGRMIFTCNEITNDLSKFLSRIFDAEDEIIFGCDEPPETRIRAQTMRVERKKCQQKLSNKTILVKNLDGSITKESYAIAFENLIPAAEIISFKFEFTLDYFKFSLGEYVPIVIKSSASYQQIHDLITQLNHEYREFIIQNASLVDDNDLLNELNTSQ